MPASKGRTVPFPVNVWYYAQTRNYQEAARRLGLDRRTVKSNVDPALLEQLGPSFGEIVE